MTDAAERIKQGLENMGYAPVIENHGAYPSVVVIEYKVRNGRFRGNDVRFGISMDAGVAWPEYPPHFVHVSPVHPDIRSPRDGGGVHGEYPVTGTDGKEHFWIAFSRPPGPFWDALPAKGITGYMEHVTRFWENI